MFVSHNICDVDSQGTVSKLFIARRVPREIKHPNSESHAPANNRRRLAEYSPTEEVMLSVAWDGKIRVPGGNSHLRERPSAGERVADERVPPVVMVIARSEPNQGPCK